MNGRKILQTTRLSKMTWYTRLIRWFGFGGSTLKSVASFLQSYEPYLPGFSFLKDKSLLSYHYNENAINNLTNIEKKRWNTLKKQKTQGCEVFKQCVSNHNRRHIKKVYILLQEHEKTDLKAGCGYHASGGIFHHFPNPIGVFQNENEKTLRERYKPPIIDLNEFLYLDPFFRKKTNHINPKILGFCQEYGLGTERNEEKAVENYRKAANDNDYSACYNFARLILKKNNVQEALDALKKGEDILLKKIDNAQKFVEKIRVKPKHILFKECFDIPELERAETAAEYDERMKTIETHDRYIKKCNKDLKKIYAVFIEAYKRMGDSVLKAEYEQKAEQITAQ